MNAFRHILVPTDFSAAANHALDLAADLATSFDAKLTLMHAVTLPVTAYAEGLYWPIDALEREARKMLDDVVAKARPRCPRINSVLTCGVPWELILGTAKDRQVDLIVMGTHGRRGLHRMILGSVAEKVLRLSPVPVLTCQASEGEETSVSTKDVSVIQV
jgi:nucleotide-binding universal stress UspA family protein